MDDDDRDRRIRALEAELAATRRLFRLDDVPTFTLNDRGMVVWHNGRWFGESPPNCMGRPIWELFDAESRPTLQRAAAAGWIGMSAQHLQLQDGRDVTLSVVESAPHTWLVAIRDISRRLQVDEALDQRRQLRSLADFAGSVARELTDSLTVAHTRLELLHSGTTDEAKVRKHVAVSYEHVRRLATGLRNLRQVGRASVLGREPVSVNEALERALVLLGTKRDRVTAELDDDLVAGGDAATLARVLSGLARASLEGAGRSKVLIRASRAREGVMVSVGPVGRPRGEPDAARTGLAMEAALVQGNGGDLWAWRRGNDRSFQVRLPVAPQVSKPKRSVAQHVVLVGSDSFHEAVQHVLGPDGFEFHCVMAPSEAIDLLEGRPEVRMVGVDLVQPRHGDGVEVAEGMLDRYPELAGGLVVAGPRLRQRLPDGLVGVSWPIRRREWLDVARRRTRR